jgi:hypothetical protein
VSLCRDENREAWRGEERRNEVPRRRCAPRLSHDPRVGCHAQKLVEAPALRRRMHGHRHGLSERCERRLKLFEPRGMVEPE